MKAQAPRVVKIACHDGELLECRVDEMDCYLSEGLEAVAEVEAMEAEAVQDDKDGLLTFHVEPATLAAAAKFKAAALVKDYQAAWDSGFNW